MFAFTKLAADGGAYIAAGPAIGRHNWARRRLDGHVGGKNGRGGHSRDRQTSKYYVFHKTPVSVSTQLINPYHLLRRESVTAKPHLTGKMTRIFVKGLSA
jgi:hypothetical protein